MDRGRASTPIAHLVGGSLGALALVALRVPAGAVLGAVLGSALVGSVRRRSQPLPRPVQVTGLVLLGCAAGSTVDGDSLRALAHLALPLGVGVLVLIVVDLALAYVLSRRFGIDAVTALFACIPGGVSDVVGVAQAAGARVELVICIHIVRVLVVVLLALPAVVVILGSAT